MYSIQVASGDQPSSPSKKQKREHHSSVEGSNSFVLEEAAVEAGNDEDDFDADDEFGVVHTIVGTSSTEDSEDELEETKSSNAARSMSHSVSGSSRGGGKGRSRKQNG